MASFLWRAWRGIAAGVDLSVCPMQEDLIESYGERHYGLNPVISKVSGGFSSRYISYLSQFHFGFEDTAIPSSSRISMHPKHRQHDPETKERPIQEC